MDWNYLKLLLFIVALMFERFIWARVVSNIVLLFFIMSNSLGALDITEKQLQYRQSYTLNFNL